MSRCALQVDGVMLVLAPALPLGGQLGGLGALLGLPLVTALKLAPLVPEAVALLVAAAARVLAPDVNQLKTPSTAISTMINSSCTEWRSQRCSRSISTMPDA